MLFQLSMYYLSFTPLWITVILMDIFSIANNNANLWTEYLSILLLLTVFIFAIIIVKKGLDSKKRDNTQEYKLKTAKEEKFLAAEFLMSFVLPLFAFSFTKFQDVILFLVFFLIFGWLCIRHNYFCVNVILEIMDYKIYDCIYQTFDGVSIEKKIISSRPLPQYCGLIIRVRSLNNEYALDCYAEDQ